MSNILVGFFHVDGVGAVSVSTPLTGEGSADYDKLWSIVRKKHPKKKKEQITRTGSTIEPASSESRIVEYPVGATLKQLFNEEDKDEVALHIGSVTFGEEPCDIVLRFMRARNVVGVSLKERATRSTIRFSDQISAMRLALETPQIVKGILGNDARELTLTLKEVGTAGRA